jgi:hypothetical protein
MDSWRSRAKAREGKSLWGVKSVAGQVQRYTSKEREKTLQDLIRGWLKAKNIINNGRAKPLGITER